MQHERRLVGIDVIRFLAAFMVMTFHLAFWTWAQENSTPASIIKGVVKFPELASISWWGKYGVDIFFMISGFVIAYSAAVATPLSFLRSRFLRLFPAAFICATATLMVRMLGDWIKWPSWVTWWWNSITFDLHGPWIDGVYWTLGVELCFYAAVFGLLLLRRFDRIEWLAFCLTMLTALKMLSVSGVIEVPAVMSARNQQLLMLHHGAAFGTGIFLWVGAFKGWTPLRALGLVSTCVVAGVSVYFDSNWLAYLAKSDRLVAVTVWFIAVLATIGAVVFDKHISPAVSPRWSSAIRAMGLSTYPLYLIHDVVGAYMIRVLAIMGVNRFAALALVMIVLVAISTTLLLALESQLRRAIVRGMQIPTQGAMVRSST